VRADECEMAANLRRLKPAESRVVKRKHFFQFVVSIWIVPPFYTHPERRRIILRRSSPIWLNLDKLDARNALFSEYFTDIRKRPFSGGSRSSVFGMTYDHEIWLTRLGGRTRPEVEYYPVI
jgi:hypothetical protein